MVRPLSGRQLTGQVLIAGLLVVAACSGSDDESEPPPPPPAAEPPSSSPAAEPPSSSPAAEPGLTSTILGMNEDGSLATGAEKWNRNPDVEGDGTVVTATIRNDGDTPEKPGPWALQRWTDGDWETVGFLSNGQSRLCTDPDTDCLILPADFGPLSPGEAEARAASAPEPLPAGTYRIDATNLTTREPYELTT